MTAPAPEVLTYRKPYLQRLLELREKHDLMPWLEVTSANIPSRSPITAQGRFSITPAYGLVFDEIPFIGWFANYPWRAHPDPPGPDIVQPFGPGSLVQLSTGACQGYHSVGASLSQVSESLGFVTTDVLHGIPEDEWVKYIGGILLKETTPRSWEQWQETVQLALDYGVNSTILPPVGPVGDPQFINVLSANYLYAGLRGYRLFPKNSLHPAQKTREEYLAEGKYLQKFSYTAAVTVTIGPSGIAVGATTPTTAAPFSWSVQNNGGPTVEYELVFNSPLANNSDFLCHNIRIRPQSMTGQAIKFVDSIAVAMQPLESTAIGLQSGFFPWRMSMGADLFSGPAAVSPKLLGQWHLPVPLTVAYNSRWNLLARALMSTNPVIDLSFNPDPTFTVTMEFIFDGELILSRPP